MEECKDRLVMLFLLHGRANAKGRLAVGYSAGCSMLIGRSRATVYLDSGFREVARVAIAGYLPDYPLLCCAFASCGAR
jgi:hypothetical protein